MATKKIELKLLVNPNSIYSSSGKPYVTYCSKPIDGKTSQLVSFATCREALINNFRQYVNNVMGDTATQSSKNLWKKRMIPIDKSRLIFMRKAGSGTVVGRVKEKLRFEREMRQGVRVANMIEENAGWPKTKLFPVMVTDWIKTGSYEQKRKIDKNPAEVNKHIFVYIVEGTNKWFSSPYLLSMWSLMIRGGKMKAIQKIRTLKGLMTRLKSARREHMLYHRGNRKQGKNHNGPDTVLIFQSFELWPILTKNYSTIFKDRDIAKNYSHKILKGANAASEGIHVLSCGNSSDVTIKKRVAEMCDKQNIPLNIYSMREYK